MAISNTDLNAQGVRVRQAIEILKEKVTDPQTVLIVQYVQQVVNNMLYALEVDAGVVPSYFGSFGTKLMEMNPFDGLQLPAAVSREAPLLPPTPTGT